MKHTTKELAARVGLGVDRIRDWIDDGRLSPLNPDRRRVQGHGEGYMFGRQAVFAAAMARLADDAGLGYATVHKVTRFCDRADFPKHFADGDSLLYCNKAVVRLVHRDAHIFSRGPIQLVLFDLQDLWQKFNAQMDKLEAEESAETVPVGGRPREMRLASLVETGHAKL